MSCRSLPVHAACWSLADASASSRSVMPHKLGGALFRSRRFPNSLPAASLSLDICLLPSSLTLLLSPSRSKLFPSNKG